MNGFIQPYRVALILVILPILALDARLPVRLELVDSLPYNQGPRPLNVPWSGSTDVFYKRDDPAPGGPDGIFTGPASPFLLEGTTVENNSVSSIFIEGIAGSNLLFSAFKYIDDRGQKSIYLNQSEIVSRDSPLPGFPSPHPAAGGPFGRASVDECGQVAFHVAEYRIREVDQPSAIMLWDGTDFTTIASEGETFGVIHLGTRPVVDDKTVTFIYGKTAWGPSNPPGQGIYQWTGDDGQGGLERIVDPTSPVVGGGTVGGTFMADMLDVDGPDLAWVNGGGRNLFKQTQGGNRLVAFSGMPIEGSSAYVNSFAYPTLRNGSVVFLAGRGSLYQGIYTDMHGPVYTIVDTQTNLGDKSARRFELAPGGEWASDNSIYFFVEFSDFSSGIFKATWGRPLMTTTEITEDGDIRFEFNTSPGFTYHLRSSPDFLETQPVESVAGNGERLHIKASVGDVSGNPAEFFWIVAE
jgi:hypothetical protein